MSVLPSELAPTSRRIPAEPARTREVVGVGVPAFPAVRLLGVVLIAAFTWRALHAHEASGAQLLLPLLIEAVASLSLIGLLLAFRGGREAASAGSLVTLLRLCMVAVAGLLLSQLVLALNADEPFRLAALGGLGAAFDELTARGLVSALVVAMILAGVVGYAVWRRPRVELAPALRSLGLRGLLLTLWGPWIFLGFDGAMRAQLVWLCLVVTEIFAFWAPWAMQHRLMETEAIDFDEVAERGGR